MHRDRLMTKIITGAEDRIRASIANYLLKAMGIPTFPVFASQGKEQRSISKKNQFYSTVLWMLAIRPYVDSDQGKIS